MMLTKFAMQRADIIQGLGALGLQAGMGLVVHSSLRSLGHVEDGAATVVAALMEVITPAGTLIMPSFNHGAPFETGGPGYYDPRETPTTNGAIPDHFWRMPGVYRSLDPTHPFAAWGRHARRYTEFHHHTLTMGLASPLGLLWQDDGYCLLLGVDYGSNTFHHAVETATGAPCLGQRTEAYPVQLPDGRRVMGRTWGWRERACPLTDQGRYIPTMGAIQQQGLLGDSTLILYRLRDGYTVIADLLAHGIADYPPCRKCPIRPRRVPETVPSDWDPIAQRLLPDSTAHTY
jgi:aminoglycoside N3'-acetyltransferase